MAKLVLIFTLITVLMISVESKMVPQKSSFISRILQKPSAGTPSELVICPSGSMCPDANTCCLTKAGRYGCCPLPDAVCCSDMRTCCPHGTTCDVYSKNCRQWKEAKPLKLTACLTIIPKLFEITREKQTTHPNVSKCHQVPFYDAMNAYRWIELIIFHSRH